MSLTKTPVLFPLFVSCSLPLMLLFFSEFQFLDFVAKLKKECALFFISLNDLFLRFWKKSIFLTMLLSKNCFQNSYYFHHSIFCNNQFVCLYSLIVHLPAHTSFSSFFFSLSSSCLCSSSFCSSCFLLFNIISS